jgi:UDP-N-acetylmuramoylalanine--D-glutamate ligase
MGRIQNYRAFLDRGDHPGRHHINNIEDPVMMLADKKVTILGAQRSGDALARLALRAGARPKVSEQRPEACVPAEFRGWLRKQGIAFECGGHTRSFIEDSDVVVLSPGVPVGSAPVQWAQAKGILVLGEIEFAAQFCDNPIIAITGSNGKTTVTTLIHNVLDAAGRRPCLCGNIGYPFSGYVLDLEGKNDFVVLEISSFQLETILSPQSSFHSGSSVAGWRVKGFKPHVAVILNFNQNHLDRHKDLREYFDAKKRIFINQDARDYAVLNLKDARLARLGRELKSRVVYFDPASKEADNPNFAVVLKVAEILGIDPSVCKDVFRQFKGVEHRMEWVRQVDGVDFINDSKSTTAQAAIWALERLKRPVVMICGGRDKNIDFSVLTPFVREKVKGMFVIGEAREKLIQTFQGVVDVRPCETLEDAVISARGAAVKGDAVLLSPMCASFDMFRDYEDRGRAYKEIVNRMDSDA